jgi:hypothetical protein
VREHDSWDLGQNQSPSRQLESDRFEFPMPIQSFKNFICYGTLSLDFQITRPTSIIQIWRGWEASLPSAQVKLVNGQLPSVSALSSLLILQASFIKWFKLTLSTSSNISISVKRSISFTL